MESSRLKVDGKAARLCKENATAQSPIAAEFVAGAAKFSAGADRSQSILSWRE
jgi:hypothetical protein